MSDIDVGNLLGLVIVGGVAMKVADNLTKPRESSNQQPTKKNKKRVSQENGFVQQRQVFGSGKYSPF